MRVGVKFCGNCNPVIDGAKLLQDICKEAGEACFVSASDEPYHLLLVISGCEIDCATRPRGTENQVVVAGCTVNRRPVRESGLAKETAKAVLKQARKSI